MSIFLKSSLIRPLKITRCLIVVNIFSVSSIQILISFRKISRTFCFWLYKCQNKLQLAREISVLTSSQFRYRSPGTLLVDLTNEQSLQYLLKLNLHLFILVYEMPGYTRAKTTGLLSPCSEGCFLSELFNPVHSFSSARELCKQPFIFNLAVTLSIES